MVFKSDSSCSLKVVSKSGVGEFELDGVFSDDVWSVAMKEVVGHTDSVLLAVDVQSSVHAD